MSQKPIDLSALPGEPVEVRLYHAKSGNDPEVLSVLSKDSFWFVRNYVALNIHAPEECLQELLKDPDFRISRDAKRTLQKQERERQAAPSEWQQSISKLSLNERLMAVAARASGMHSSGEKDPSHDR